MKKYVAKTIGLFTALMRNPGICARTLNMLPFMCEARSYAKGYRDSEDRKALSYAPSGDNPLWSYFLANQVGPGIWKREHYFDVYHRHLAKFVGTKANLLEIGVFSGGSLKMWRTYLGEQCRIIGMDIEKACKAYEDDRISILIGDQSDRNGWKAFRESSEGVDILIDDGGHTVEQQQITLEEMLPFLRPGGVYICEDVHGPHNKFAAYAASLVHDLNVVSTPAPSFQSSIFSIHFYPYLVVIEKHGAPVVGLPSCRNGTEWQPFFDWMSDAPGKNNTGSAPRIDEH